MLYQYLLGHFRWTIQDDMLVGKASDMLQRMQELNGHADIRDALDQLHLKGLVARLQALVDLLQSQQTCNGMWRARMTLSALINRGERTL